jgi:hypothetical protein
VVLVLTCGLGLGLGLHRRVSYWYFSHRSLLSYVPVRTCLGSMTAEGAGMMITEETQMPFDPAHVDAMGRFFIVFFAS